MWGKKRGCNVENPWGLGNTAFSCNLWLEFWMCFLACTILAISHIPFYTVFTLVVEPTSPKSISWRLGVVDDYSREQQEVKNVLCQAIFLGYHSFLNSKSRGGMWIILKYCLIFCFFFLPIQAGLFHWPCAEHAWWKPSIFPQGFQNRRSGNGEISPSVGIVFSPVSTVGLHGTSTIETLILPV